MNKTPNAKIVRGADGRFAAGNNIYLGVKQSKKTIAKRIATLRRNLGGNGGFWKGKTFSSEVRAKLSASKKGEKHWNWKGGITSQSARLRNNRELRLWREAVYKRDSKTCVLCGITNVKVCADHIKSFREYPELRYDIKNGRTLCYPCHMKTETFGGRNRALSLAGL